jgi:hypothetical protein
MPFIKLGKKQIKMGKNDIRGFYGDYELEVSLGGKLYKAEFVLEKGITEIRVDF